MTTASSILSTLKDINENSSVLASLEKELKSIKNIGFPYGNSIEKVHVSSEGSYSDWKDLADSSSSKVMKGSGRFEGENDKVVRLQLTFSEVVPKTEVMMKLVSELTSIKKPNLLFIQELGQVVSEVHIGFKS